jgi:hypothetical protein
VDMVARWKYGDPQERQTQPNPAVGNGAMASNPRACSSAAADRSTTRSACWGPISWIPTGSPVELNPAQMDAAGERVMLKG